MRTMKYSDFIKKYLGAGLPFDDLETDIFHGCNYPEDAEEITEIYESGFGEIFEYLISIGVSQGTLEAFIRLWADCLKHEKEGFQNPFQIANELKALNKNLGDICEELRKHNKHMETIGDSLYTEDGEAIADTIDRLVFSINEVTEHRKDNRGEEYALIRVCGMVDTYEQNY